MHALPHPLRFFATALALVSLWVTVAAADATAAPAARVSDAISVATGGDGIAAVCARQAKRKVLRMTPQARPGTGAKASRTVARQKRRTGAALRRRCMNRLRAAAKRRQRTSLPTQAPGRLVIGIDGGYAGWSESETGQRAALGAAVTRHEWEIADPVDDQDDVVWSAAAEIHTRIHALLGGNQLGDPGHYREWVVAFIRRYGVGGSFWAAHPELDASRYAITTIELGNEPYFGEMSPELYADTVRPTLEEIRRLALPVQVVLPSRVYGNDTSWMDTLYERIPDLNNLFYAFADHPYWYAHDPALVSPAGPFGRIETLRERMNELGAETKPIFITEYGESTASCAGECVDETTQAQHLRQMIDAVVSRPDWGVKMLSVFQLRDRGTGSADRELQFGLIREDGTPKPSYSIVQGAMQQYRG